jgi:oligo-1,6-glucosidase
MVGELVYTEAADVLDYVSADARELDMVFDFDMVCLGGRMDVPAHETWRHTLPEFKEAVTKVQHFLFAENHDQGRSISRFATDDAKHHLKAGKLFATLLGTLSGTLFLYQGQEIGMTNIPQDWGAPKNCAIQTTRDNARTPV